MASATTGRTTRTPRTNQISSFKANGAQHKPGPVFHFRQLSLYRAVLSFFPYFLTFLLHYFFLKKSSPIHPPQDPRAKISSVYQSLSSRLPPPSTRCAPRLPSLPASPSPSNRPPRKIPESWSAAAAASDPLPARGKMSPLLP